MEKIFLILLICSCIQITISAQNFWEYKGTLPSVTSRMDINSNGYIFVNVFLNGFYISTTDGSTWQSLPLSPRYPYDIKVDNDDVVYASCSEGVYRSTANGFEWGQINNGFTDSSRVHCFAFNTNNHIFAGAEDGEVYRSENNGENWVKISNGFTTSDIYLISVNANNDIFAVLYNSGIYRSIDNGLTWEEINIGLANQFVTSLIFNSANVLFAATSGGGVFRSSNNGDNWIPINNGLTSVETRALAINSYDYVFVSSAEGVFRSTNDGNMWTQINSGLNNYSFVSVLAINPSENIFTVVSHDVYRSLNPTTNIVNEDDNFPSRYSLSQNYPNPFNPSTTITYQIPEREFVTLKVYGILGREVATLVNEEKPAGSYEIEFAGYGLTSGIYFYQLKTGNYSETKKMILIR
jgi:photosystem II stability/assembly factor-like uncharacterized protein